jgi:hypothetical protein
MQQHRNEEASLEVLEQKLHKMQMEKTRSTKSAVNVAKNHPRNNKY